MEHFSMHAALASSHFVIAAGVPAFTIHVFLASLQPLTQAVNSGFG
jgi:uncharacterized integral membrane protein